MMMIAAGFQPVRRSASCPPQDGLAAASIVCLIRCVPTGEAPTGPHSQDGCASTITLKREQRTTLRWYDKISLMRNRNKVDRAEHRLMKMINSLDVPAGTPKVLGAGPETLLPVTNARARRRDVLPLREALPLWFAVSSPLIGLILGFLGAWFVTWLTS